MKLEKLRLYFSSSKILNKKSELYFGNQKIIQIENVNNQRIKLQIKIIKETK